MYAEAEAEIKILHELTCNPWHWYQNQVKITLMYPYPYLCMLPVTLVVNLSCMYVALNCRVHWHTTGNPPANAMLF